MVLAERQDAAREEERTRVSRIAGCGTNREKGRRVLGESRAHRDLRLEEAGNRAPFLGRLRGGLKLRGIGAGNLRADIEVNRLDRPARVRLVEVQGRLCLNPFRSIADLLEFARKGHRETPRM